MRRRSIVGPLFLIGLGALLLARNLYPELPFGEYIGNYWPYMLIAWGVIRLAEITFLSSRGRPLPVRGVSGGEWLMVVFLILVGIGIQTAQRMPPDWQGRAPWGDIDIFNEHFEYPVSAEHPASKAARITVEDFRGNIALRGTAENGIKLTGHKTISAMTKESADEGNTSSSFEITGDENDLKIHLRDGGLRRAVRVSGVLEIDVPRGATLQIARRDGDVRILDIDGPVSINGRGSDVNLEGISGPVIVEGTFRSIRARNVSNTMSFNGRNTQFTARQISGNLMVDSGDLVANGLVGPISITSRSADLRLTGFTNALDLTLQRGDVHLEPGRLPLGPMRIQSRSGDVDVVLPEGAQFKMHASTDRGDISNSLNDSLKLVEGGRAQTLTGSVGDGPAVEIKTNRGDISITKGSVITVPDSLSDTAKKQVLEKVEQ